MMDNIHYEQQPIRKAMPLHTTLPAFFASRGFASIQVLSATAVELNVIIMGSSPGDVGEATEGL